MKFIITGLFLHLIFLISIFDIYFTTPLIHGMTPHATDKPAEAKRLVLIVADGLRAESIYGNNYSNLNEMHNLAPHLSSIINERGCWGISHTRVPTESRPGHVALAAGIYEDPSAVAKGWKENPVEFDSVFNESRYTWAWGSPDIVHMFSKVNNVYAHSYSAEEEDFSGKVSASLLDIWVFDKVEKFFSLAQNDSILGSKIHADKIIFFLHLLGLDTTGHSKKPYSIEHINNIKVVDKGIKEIEALFNTFYNDNKTNFVFTADHGMTDWGSHGASSKNETETPFITWGAGIKIKSDPVEIHQADIAPFISSLLAIPVPMNSVGVLPCDCLNMSESNLASAVFANAKQIFAQFNEKRRKTEQNLFSFLFSPFPDLSIKEFEKIISEIENLINSMKYAQAIKSCQYLINVATKGLDYYQNYYQRILLFCISISYIGWILLLLISLIENSNSKQSLKVNRCCIYDFYENKNSALILHISLFITIAITVCLLYVQSLPPLYYVYCTVPQIIWYFIIKQTHIWLQSVKTLLQNKNEAFKTVICIILYLIGVELLVLSFFDRSMLSVSLIVMSIWPYFLESTNLSLKLSWTITSLSLTVFPIMPVIGHSFNYIYIGVTGIIWIAINFGFTFLPILFSNYNQHSVIDKKQTSMTLIQNILLLIAEYNLYAVDTNIKNNIGLTFENQMLSWLLLGISLFLPLFGSELILYRLFNIAMSYLVPFILLSVSYEPLFLLVLFLNLLFWLTIENNKYSPNYEQILQISFNNLTNRKILYTTRKNIDIEDFRRGYFFLLYVVLAFFGLGNIASVNSFDPMWVRNFVTVFSPFMMSALILFKILIPYIIVSCVFRAVTVCLQAPVHKMFFIILIFCDVMGLRFLFLVTNYGSWLEIGTSISHFVIVQAMVFFVLLLYGVAIVLTQITFDFRYKRKKMHLL